MSKEITLTEVELFAQLALLEEQKPGSLGRFKKIQDEEAQAILDEQREKSAKILDHLGKELDRIGIGEITITRSVKGTTPTMKLTVRKASGNGGKARNGKPYDPASIDEAVKANDLAILRGMTGSHIARWVIENKGNKGARQLLKAVCPFMTDGNLSGNIRTARENLGLATSEPAE
jgi:hypothetical protein